MRILLFPFVVPHRGGTLRFVVTRGGGTLRFVVPRGGGTLREMFRHPLSIQAPSRDDGTLKAW